MDKYRVPFKLSRIIADYLKNRKIKLNDTHYLEFNIGVPQGSSLGPTLWLLIMNELLVNNKNKDYLMIAYADDIAVLSFY